MVQALTLASMRTAVAVRNRREEQGRVEKRRTETDMDFKLERRDPWHGGGQSKATFDFHQAVFAAPNLLAILAGHTHRQAIDVKNNVPQWVGGHNATGFFTDLRINPDTAR